MNKSSYIFATKIMNKITNMALMATMLSSMAVPAFAAELTQDAPTGNSTAVYQAGKVGGDNGTPDNPTDDKVAGTYTITIPDYITVAKDEVSETNHTVTAKEALLPYGHALNLKVEFSPQLKLQGQESVLLNYQLKNKGAVINTQDNVLTVNAGTPEAVTTTEMSASLTAKPLYSGIYTDTVTFTSSVDAVPGV